MAAKNKQTISLETRKSCSTWQCHESGANDCTVTAPFPKHKSAVLSAQIVDHIETMLKSRVAYDRDNWKRSKSGISYMISHMLPVGGTVGPPKAESSPGVHGSRSSQVPFTPVSSSTGASLAGCQIWDLETDSEDLLKLDSVLSVQLAYPVLHRGMHHPLHVSAAPVFIVLSPHIPLDALMLKITGKRSSPDNLAFEMLGSSLHTNSVFSRSDATRDLESFQRAAEVVRSEQQQLRTWQECWSLAKVRVAFCMEQCVTSLPVMGPCLFATTILLVFCVYVSLSTVKWAEAQTVWDLKVIVYILCCVFIHFFVLLFVCWIELQ